VIGGGPGGATAALLLAQAGWSVLVLEKKSFPRRKVCGEYLSATNLPLFERLGIVKPFLELSGPDVTRVGLFTGRLTLRSDLPRDPSNRWGRALGRESLDGLLLDKAREAGALIHQPATVTRLERLGDIWEGQAEDREMGQRWTFAAPVVIAAHGSWDAGSLPSQPSKTPPRPSDLLGFKAHFRNADLPDGLMPLLAFPGGYGGMVHTDAGRVSISLCVRRDRLAEIRSKNGRTAGEDVGEYVMASCVGVKTALSGAVREGEWLAAGRLRPGIRLRHPPGLFPVGIAAGEAHPVIAEGISMAAQSAWLLTDELKHWRTSRGRTDDLPAVAAAYSKSWTRNFAPRLRAAALIAHWAMNPALIGATLPLLRFFPAILTAGARASGKVRRIV
jgi:flavin-dependent dehydrogenase